MKYESIIIVGYPRSGTSLLRVILDSHPDIAIGPELKFIRRIVRKFPKSFDEFFEISKLEGKDFFFTKSDLESIYEHCNNWHKLYEDWCKLNAAKNRKQIWGEKTPNSYIYLPKLIKKFPNSLFIYIVRNPLDVMGSLCKKGWYKGLKSILAWTYSNIMSLLLDPYNSIIIRYEDLVDEPDIFIKNIFIRINIPYHDDILDKYWKISHGRIAEGDIWNKPIMKSKETEKRHHLKLKDKILVYLICFYFMYKYRYL